MTRYWDFCEKMWHLSKSKESILLYELTNIPKVAAPKGELQSPDEEKTTFSHKYPDFSSNSTRFLGSKVAIFFCGKVRKIFAGSWRKIETPKKFSGFFREERATFDPKRRVEFKEKLGSFSRNVALFSSGVDNSSVGTTTSGICRLLLEELQSPDEENTTFFENNPDFLLKLGFRNWLKIR